MQTNYDNSLISREFYVGQVYDNSLRQVDDCHLAGEYIPFGAAVYYDADTSTVKVLTDGSAGKEFFGIAVRTEYETVGQILGGDTYSDTTTLTMSRTGYVKGSFVNVMKLGRIVVRLTGANDKIGTGIWWDKTNANITEANLPKIVAKNTAPTQGDVLIGYALTTPKIGEVAIQITGVKAIPVAE